MQQIKTFEQLTQVLELALPSPLQPFAPDWLGSEQHQLVIKRDDLIHPIISGNKWRKLTQPVTQLASSSPKRVISFGGGFSNHLHALGYILRQLNVPFTALIRGDYSNNMTPMLSDLTQWHCELRWLNKITYKKRAEPDFLNKLHNEYPNSLVIPEGGSSTDAFCGLEQMVNELPLDIDYLLCPVASGGTLAGIARALNRQNRNCTVIGIAVLKGQNYLEQLVSDLFNNANGNHKGQEKTREAQQSNNNFRILHDYHFGGYAKSTTELTEFCRAFSAKYRIPLEPIYSGKLFFAARELVASGFFSAQSKVCLLHTGGIQGAR